MSYRFSSPAASLAALTVAGTLAFGPGTALAQGPESEALRRVQLQLRQSEQERNALRSEVARLQSLIESNRTELEVARERLSKSSQELLEASAAARAKESRVSKTADELQQREAELNEVRTRNARLEQAAANAQGMLTNAQNTLGLREELLGLCRARNQDLYNIGNEALNLYRNVSFGDIAAKREPVFQFNRTRLENRLQDFEDRLRQSRVTEDTLPPSVEQQLKQQGATAATSAQ